MQFIDLRSTLGRMRISAAPPLLRGRFLPLFPLSWPHRKEAHEEEGGDEDYNSESQGGIKWWAELAVVEAPTVNIAAAADDDEEEPFDERPDRDSGELV
ncbi:hypothetical protein Ancab_020011 [Ancistrocladus abbreviatus]